MAPNYGVGSTEYMRSRGAYGVTRECGQHEDPQEVGVARQAILQTLALLKMLDWPLETSPADREHTDDSFPREWRSFDAVKAGELIGTRHSGAEVRAPHDGFVVFPNPRAEPGQECFYLAKQRQ